MPENNIPNSGDLAKIASSMKSLASNINVLAPALSELAKAMSSIRKINVNDIVEGSTNMSAVAAATTNIAVSVQQFGQALSSMAGSIKPADLNTISVIPNAVRCILDTFILAGDRRTATKAKRGMIFLIGKDGHSGLMKGILDMNSDISKTNFNPKSYQDIVKVFDILGKSLKGICTSLAVAALLGIPAYVGAMLMFGIGPVPGVLTLVVNGMVKLGEYINTLKDGQKVILYIAAAIGMLAATLGVLILMGVFAVKYWKQVLAAMGFTVILVGLFILLAWSTRFIKAGARNILRIAETLAIIALTALLLALLGQFVKANWKAFLTVGAYMLVLVGVFLLLAASTKFIKAGARNILYVAAAVALLALTAVLLVLVGEYLDANWESLIAITLVMGVLMATIFIVSKATKRIQKGVVGMIMLMVFTTLMVGAIWAVTEIAESADLEKTLWTTGIMFGIIVGIGAITVAAGELQSEIEKGIIAMGVIAGISTIMTSVMIGLATASQIADPLEILAVTGIMALIIVAVGALSIAAGALIMGPQAVLFLAGLAAIATITLICGAIAGVALIMTTVTKAVEATGFDNAQDLARVLTLPFAAIMAEGEDGKSLLGLIWDLPNPVVLAIMTSKVIGLASVMCFVGLIAHILQNIASLNMPDPTAGYDKDGNPLGWKQMQAKDFADAAINAATILGITSAMFADEDSEFTLADGTPVKIRPISLANLDKIGWLTRIKVKSLSKIVGYVGNMAVVLQHIASLNMPTKWNTEGQPTSFRQMTSDDFTMAAANAGSILTYFASLFADEPVQVEVMGKMITIGVQSKWMAGLDNISRSVRRKVERLGEIVGYVGNMADTIQKVATLNIPMEWDDKGKPVVFRQMTDNDFTTASENVALIAITLASAISDPTLAEQLEDMDSDAAENFKTIMEPMGMIKNIIDVIQMLGEDRYVKTWKTGPNGEQIPDEVGSFSQLLSNATNIQNNITSMVDIIVGSFAPYNHGKKESMVHDAEDEIENIAKVTTQGCTIIKTLVDTYNTDLKTLDVNDYSEKWDNQMAIMAKMMYTMGGGGVDEAKARALAKNIDNTVKLIRQINGVNVDKLKYAEGIMKSLATVSTQIKGNFDGLARTINEKLIRALEKLEKVLKQVADKDFEGGFGGGIPDTIPNPNGGGSESRNPEDKKTPVATRKDAFAETQIRTQQDLFDAVDDIRDYLLSGDKKRAATYGGKSW